MRQPCPISCAVGSAVLDEFERHGLVERAEHCGAKLRAGLEAIMDRSPIVGDVRGLGMLLAVEMVLILMSLIQAQVVKVS